MKNIVLIGFMGAGKSTVGRRLAQKIGWDFVDTDHIIETREKMVVSDIFKGKGEPYFRKLESAVLEEVLARPRCVVSTGGGVVVEPRNLSAILERSHAVCLWINAEAAYERTRHHTHRPLLQSADPLGSIRKILAEREPLYRQAHYIVDTTGRTVPEICEFILRYVRRCESAAADQGSGTQP